jgi:hypothetical protein
VFEDTRYHSTCVGPGASSEKLSRNRIESFFNVLSDSCTFHPASVVQIYILLNQKHHFSYSHFCLPTEIKQGPPSYSPNQTHTTRTILTIKTSPTLGPPHPATIYIFPSTLSNPLSLLSPTLNQPDKPPQKHSSSFPKEKRQSPKTSYQSRPSPLSRPCLSLYPTLIVKNRVGPMRRGR